MGELVSLSSGIRMPWYLINIVETSVNSPTKHMLVCLEVRAEVWKHEDKRVWLKHTGI